MDLKRRTIALYAGASFPLSVVGLPLVIYIPPLYGELGVPLALLGSIVMVARLSDVVTDPMIGILSDKTRTRIGRRKPWMLAGTPIMMLSTYMLFVPPEAPSLLYVGFWIVMIYLAYTLIGLPYLAWGAELSSTYHGRSTITAWREQFGLAGTLVATGLPIVLTVFDYGSIRQIVFVEAVIICVMMPLVMGLCTGFVPEPREITINRTTTVDFRTRLRIIGRNGPFVRILIGYTGCLIAGSMDGAVSFFFCKHVLNQEPWYAFTLLCHILAAVVGVPIWNAVGRRIGKHRALVWAIVWYAGWAFCMPLLTVDGLPAWAVVAGFAFLQSMKGLSLGAFDALSASMAADVVDIDIARTGEQRTGLYFSVWGIIKKMAAAFAAFVALTGIGLFGFDATLDPDDAYTAAGNSTAALVALTLGYSFLPSCFKLSVLPFLWRYPLTAERQARIHARIERLAAARARV